MLVYRGRPMPKLYLLALTLMTGMLAPMDHRAQNAAEQLPASKCWEVGYGNDVVEDAETTDDITVLALRSGRLIGISQTGQTLWLTDVGGVVVSNLVIVGNSIFFVSRPAGDDAAPPREAALREFSSQTGLPVFSFALGKEENWKIFTVNKDLLLIDARRIGYFSLPEKRLLWERPFDDDGQKVLAVDDEVVWINGKGGGLFSISVADGSNAARLPSQNARITAGVFSDQPVVGDETGIVRAIGKANGDRSWQFRTGGRISHLFTTGGIIIAGSSDNHIYAFDGLRGSLRWKRRLGGRIEAVAMISPDHLLARAIGENDWEIIETRTGRLAGRVDTNGNDRNAFKALVFGPKGFGLVSSRGVAGYSLSGCEN